MKRTKTIECEKCGHIQAIKKLNNKIMTYEYPKIFTEPDLIGCKTFPLFVKLTHKGFWITYSN